jgi:hypothetical protein
MVKLGHKGIWARWALERMTPAPTAEALLLQGLEYVGLGKEFLERHAPGDDFAVEFACVVAALEGCSDGLLDKKKRWLPIGETYPDRQAAKVVLAALPGERMIPVQRLIKTGKAAGIEAALFCRTAAWMVKLEPPSVTTESMVFNVLEAFWRAS